MERFEKLVRVLSEQGLTVSAAESCTGGAFAASVVSVADASRVLSLSFVTYSEEAKQRAVGVPAETIAEYGVVSEETAAAMALGAAKTAGADAGVGITGFAGPGGGDRFAGVGTVCFGFAVQGRVQTARRVFGQMSRNEVRAAAVAFACDELLRILEDR